LVHLFERLANCVHHQVKGKPPYDSYVIDFTVLPHRGDLAEGELLPVAIVELNPFDEYTDSALFNWKLHRQYHSSSSCFTLTCWLAWLSAMLCSDVIDLIAQNTA
jgi:hypothetical protein